MQQPSLCLKLKVSGKEKVNTGDKRRKLACYQKAIPRQKEQQEHRSGTTDAKEQDKFRELESSSASFQERV